MSFPSFGAALLPAAEVFDLFDRDQHEASQSTYDEVMTDTTSPQSSSTSSAANPSDHADTQPRRGRKGHTKSRTGCLVCKKRRIKCQETKPSCDNCVKAGFGCEYPRTKTLDGIGGGGAACKGVMTIKEVQNERTVALLNNLNHYDYVDHYSKAAPLMLMPPLSATPTTFTSQDMRFFHCFLTRSYPHLPLKADKLWTIDLPVYAHEHTYLMHAMLALGAAHMATHTSDSFGKVAIDHRVKAIAGLNAALITKPKDVHEWDARYATLVALSVQAASMTDGVVDFFTTLRGCILAGEPFDESSSFSHWINTGRERVTQPKMLNAEGLGLGEYTDEAEELVAEALISINDIEDVVMPGSEEYVFWKLLHTAVANAILCPLETYKAMSSLYDIICTCPASQFAHIFDPNNTVSWLLISQSFGVHLLLRHCGAFSFYDGGPSKMRYTKRQWIRGIHAQLPPGLKKYNAWALSIAAKAEAQLLMEADQARGRREC